MICKNIPIYVNHSKSHIVQPDFQPSLTTYVLDSFQNKPRKAVIICHGRY